MPSRKVYSEVRSRLNIVITAFLVLLAFVGFTRYGLPFFFDFMTREYDWSRTVITPGNAPGMLLVAPLFGFIIGWLIDKFGPRRLMMAGVLFGVRVLGRTLVITLSANGAAELLFPMFPGSIHNKLSSYYAGFIILIVIALAGALIVSFLPKTGNKRLSYRIPIKAVNKLTINNLTYE